MSNNAQKNNPKAENHTGGKEQTEEEQTASDESLQEYDKVSPPRGGRRGSRVLCSLLAVFR